MKGIEKVTTLVSGQLTICTYGGFAPSCYKNSKGQLIGLDISFLTHFAESLGLDIVMIEKPFDNIWALPGADVCDVAGATIMQRLARNIGLNASWSIPYFEVKRALLVRSADQTEFDDYKKLSGKKIIVTRGALADIDAHLRYPNCILTFVDEMVQDQVDIQGYIAKILIGQQKVDAFAGGDLPNQYLCNKYSRNVEGGLTLADIHLSEGRPDTFNFVTRNASLHILDQLNLFIAKNKHCYWLG